MAKTTGKKKTDGASGDAPNFEKSLARLETIVETLDDGNLPLEQSLALFKEGTKLARACRELLAEAEVQVKEALRDSSQKEEAGEDGARDVGAREVGAVDLYGRPETASQVDFSVDDLVDSDDDDEEGG